MNLLSSLLNYTARQIAALRAKDTSQDGRLTTAESNISTLTSRIETAISAVTTSTEVTDIRVGDDGVTYGTAGTAVRTQFSNLKSELKPLEAVGANLLDLTTLVNNVYINNTNGTEVAYNGWKASDYIPIEPYTTYKVLYLSNGAYTEATGQNLYWAIYDSEKTFKRGGIGSGIYGEASAKYLRVSCPNSYFNSQIMVLSEADAEDISTAADYVQHLTTEAFVDKVNDLVVASKKALFSADNLEFSVGYVRYWTGVIDTSGLLCTDYLDISNYQGMLLTIKAGKPHGGNAGMAFYDANHSFINGVDYDDEGNVDGKTLSNIRVQVPKNAVYLRASTTEFLVSSFAIGLDVTGMIDNIYKYNPLLVSEGSHWVNYNPSGTKISLTDAWKVNAEQAYTNMQNYLKATNAYDFASLLIETDSHGRGTLPFNWMQKHDDSVRCCHLGDIVNDYYNDRELNYYYLNTKECKKLITIVGNHEVNFHSGDQGNQYDLIRFLDSTNRRIGGAIGCFSVIDYDQRVKYICLNPYQIIEGGSECDFTVPQMKWFLKELQDAEHDIIVLSHNAINDSNLKDRDGNSGSAYIGGPYATGYDRVEQLLKAFKNKESGTIQSAKYGQLVYDFTNKDCDLICNLAGHTHHELFKTDTYLTYVANWYGNTHCCVFFLADKTNKKVLLFQFDNSTVYDTLEFDY